jgi:hypothetical protein
LKEENRISVYGIIFERIFVLFNVKNLNKIINKIDFPSFVAQTFIESHSLIVSLFDFKHSKSRRAIFPLSGFQDLIKYAFENNLLQGTDALSDSKGEPILWTRSFEDSTGATNEDRKAFFEERGKPILG